MKTIARMAESCACKMVSKLNVSPFQSVNSPLVEPVKTRRPSGVHCHFNVLMSPQYVIAVRVSERETHSDTVHRTADFIC